MPLSDLWGLLGNAGQAATNYTDIAAAMNPALVGQAGIANALPSSAQNVASSISPNWQSAMDSASGSWKWPSSKELAETLKGAGKSSGSSSSGSDDSIKGSSLVSSGAHAGSGGISSDTVYKLLMARATPTVGQQKQGLLGV